MLCICVGFSICRILVCKGCEPVVKTRNSHQFADEFVIAFHVFCYRIVLRCRQSRTSVKKLRWCRCYVIQTSLAISEVEPVTIVSTLLLSGCQVSDVLWLLFQLLLFSAIKMATFVMFCYVMLYYVIFCGFYCCLCCLFMPLLIFHEWNFYHMNSLNISQLFALVLNTQHYIFVFFLLWAQLLSNWFVSLYNNYCPVCDLIPICFETVVTLILCSHEQTFWLKLNFWPKALCKLFTILWPFCCSDIIRAINTIILFMLFLYH